MNERKFRCGYDISHPLVIPEPEYTAWGWFLLMMGATPKPKRALYRCERCNQVIATTRDESVLREFS